MPKVSVVITTYNRANYIKEAIDSVLNQTYSDFEIIVVDDGSTDKTREIVQNYGGKVKYFYQINKGQPAAENLGIKNAEGEYIALLDDDDRWLPNKLEMQIKILDENPEIGFVCNEAHYIDEKGEIFYHWKKKDGNEESFASLYEANFLHHSSALIRKELLDKVGRFDEQLITTQDYDLWLRMSYVSKFHYINTPLSQFRHHPNNKHKNKIRKLSDRVRIIQKASQMANINPRHSRIRVAKEYYTHAEYFQDMKLWYLASETFLKAAYIYPLIGRYFEPSSHNPFIHFLPYRILRTYLRALYCFIKALLIRGQA